MNMQHVVKVNERVLPIIKATKKTLTVVDALGKMFIHLKSSKMVFNSAGTGRFMSVKVII